MEPMYYIGLDVHKRKISYCVKDSGGKIYAEGSLSATRIDLDHWMKRLPQPWTAAMEATMFTGWIYDHLKPHAAAPRVAHPLMLRAIAAAKKKNDRIDASKICDCLRCDFLPECHMAPTAIRERRRTLRYGGFFAGCKQKQNDDEAIRDAVRQHLTALGTLNLQAMDMDFTKIAVQNNQASADVSFRPKTGAPAGAAMQISYELEKQDGAWKVMKKSASGGMIEHPNPNVNPHGQDATGAVHGNLPNFQEILGSNAAAPNGTTQSNNTVSTQSGNQP